MKQLINWQSVLARHRHLDGWRSDATMSRDWSLCAHIERERAQLPHIGWITGPWPRPVPDETKARRA